MAGKREDILADITATLASATGACVIRRASLPDIAEFTEETFPLIYVADGEETLVPEKGRGYWAEFGVKVLGIIEDKDTPSTSLNLFLSQVMEGLAADITRGGAAVSTEFVRVRISSEFKPPYAGFILELKVLYLEEAL
jgi:hypothetical protein